MQLSRGKIPTGFFAKIFPKTIDKIFFVRYNILQLADANQKNKLCRSLSMNLHQAEEGKEYIIKSVETDDEELDAFLFSLGCYSGEPITVISHKKTTVSFLSKTEDTALTER